MVDTTKKWNVEFYDEQGRLDHNDQVSTFEELMDLCQGRSFKIIGRVEEEPG